MTYQTTITKKGQITIPKKIRDSLNLSETSKIIIEFDKKTHSAKIKSTNNFLQIAKTIKPKKKINPIEARKKLESEYDRN